MSTDPVIGINQGTRVEFGGSSGGGGFGGGSLSSGGAVSAPPIQVVDPCGSQPSGCGIGNEGIHAVDASLEVTGYYEQTSTGITRMFVAGNDTADFGSSRSGGTYSQLFVHDYISLDGTVQIVLQPEWFTNFSYIPHIGDTFDFFISDTGINWQPGLIFETFVTVGGASLLNWLTTSPYSSGILSDPDQLLRVSDHLFDFSLVNENNQYILRGTLVAWDTFGQGQVPEPSILWLMGSGLLGWIRFGWRREARADKAGWSRKV